MSAIDLTADPISRSLLAAIDEGDDSALAALADRLEELGDPRMLGVRHIAEVKSASVYSRFKVCDVPNADAYFVDPRRLGYYTGLLAEGTYDRLRGGQRFSYGHRYSSRSAAFLALAEALRE